MIASLDESQDRPAHDDTPRQITSFFGEGPHLRA